MKKLIMLKLNLQSFFATSVRILVTICFCAMIFAFNSVPAFAVTSNPSDGTTKLNDIQKRTDDLTKNTDDIANQDRSVYPSLKEVQSASQEGLNEIQGAANKDQMISPEDAKDATTVADSIKKTFSKVKGDK
ncbi:MAG: hypothetical protein ACRC1Z_18425 [Waterburya sp.]